MSHIYICESWHTHISESCHTDTSESCHTHVSESCHTYERVMSYINELQVLPRHCLDRRDRVSKMNESCHTHMSESWHTYTYERDMSYLDELQVFPMGWLRLVGSIQLHDSFPEYCLFNMALLQKRPII